MRTQVPSLASLSGLRIWHRRELCCRSQMWLGSFVVVTVAVAGGYSSDLTPALGTSICLGWGPKKTKRPPPPKCGHTWKDIALKQLCVRQATSTWKDSQHICHWENRNEYHSFNATTTYLLYLKLRWLNIPNTGDDAEKLELSGLPVVVKHGRATLKRDRQFLINFLKT